MTDLTSRSLNDLGLAGWFGGSLANAVALNPAAEHAADARSRGAVANTGWRRWTPVNAALIGLHLFGGAGQLSANRRRIAGQRGVASMTWTKTALTAAALGVTAYAGALGRRVASQVDVPVSSGTEPAPETPHDVAEAQRQLKLVQWAIPALTGALLVVNAYAGEQQRPAAVAKGLIGRVTP